MAITIVRTSSRVFASAIGIVGALLVIGMVPALPSEAVEPSGASVAWDTTKPASLSLIQVGDLHGHLTERPHLREDGRAESAGGLARVSSKIKDIRASSPASMLFNVGDTLQGGAEALYTRGQAMVDVLDDWRIDGYTSGNWDFFYGTQRYLELFGNGRWGALAANLYYDDKGPYADRAGQRVLPPYRVSEINNVRVGVIGFTTDRGPSAGDGKATEGFRFTDGSAELPVLVDQLRNTENVDVVVVLSEFGLAKNTQLAEETPGVDVLLSSDMHEETPGIIRTSTGTLISEVGQDGTRLGQLDLQVGGGKVTGSRYSFHYIDATVAPDPQTQAKVDRVRSSFVTGRAFEPHTNPINGTTLDTPIDTVVGSTVAPLYRGNFSDHAVPGVIEGTSHNMIADAFREQTGADIGIIHGFRYGTHVAPGDVKLEDLYHFLPISPNIATATVTGKQIKDYLENATNGVLSPNLSEWSAGWGPAVSGVRYELDAYSARGNRVQNAEVYDRRSGQWQPLDLERKYSLGGLYYPQQPTVIAGSIRIPEGSAEVVTSDTGEGLDATDVVSAYLTDNPVNPSTGRVRLREPLPAPVYGNKEIQPLRGVPTIR